MSGIGGFVWQRTDFHARNALLHDLIDYSWPVIYESGSGLVYYLTFFLIPALVGKVLGFKAAEVVLYIISVAGVIIVFLLLVSYFTYGGVTGENSVKTDSGQADSRAIILIVAITVLFAGLNEHLVPHTLKSV
ncbi:hypothetical protein [Butyrivibrio fibrisolvens]|uniref:hypothetical protein n=1 Tax=Butyrivibrio fibrisolvens TaxID=831 RepID=UPI0004871CC9|nr:hypothetical protein [Butyrivibrio fibrisolvens]